MRAIEPTDVLVVGGGVIGASTAYYLAREGAEVVAVERSGVGREASGRNAGGLHLQMGSKFARRQVAVKAIDASLRFAAAGIETWRELSGTLDGDIEFKVTGGLMVAETEAQMGFLADKIKRERAQGLDVHLLSQAELRATAPYISDRMIGAEFCPGDGRVNPLCANAAIGRAAVAAGARFLQNTELLAISREGDGYVVDTDRGTIRCRRIVNAAGPWAGSVARMVGVDLPFGRKVLQLHVSERTAPLIGHMVLHSDASLTLKQTAAGTILIGGGWLATDDPDDGHARVSLKSVTGNMRIAVRVVPGLSGVQLVRTWAGVNPEDDRAPIVGPLTAEGDFFVAVAPPAGYTVGPLLGRLVAGMILGRDAPFDISGALPGGSWD